MENPPQAKQLMIFPLIKGYHVDFLCAIWYTIMVYYEHVIDVQIKPF